MAEATIDELQIEISASSASAADNLEKLAQKLERLGNVIQPIAANNGLEKIAKQLNKLSAISQKISQLSGFEKIGQVVSELRKIEQLGNAQDISPFMRNLNKLPRIVAAISQMPSVDATKFQKLADALKPLQSVSSSGINSLMNALRKLPKVSQELSGVDFTRFSQQVEQISRAIEPLARQAERAGQGLTAIAQIMQSTSRQARQSASGFGLFNQAIGNIKVKTLAAVAALRRLFSVLKNGVTASAAYVENLNLFSVTMGESADEALRFAESVNSALGVDTSDWIRYQGVFQSIGKGFGIVSSQADLMSKNLTQMSYDISSFYNISVDTAAMKLQSALSGEIMPMRQLGFAIEETTLKQVALNHGIKMSVENMTQAQKAQLRYVAIMEQAGNIGVLGDMARTIDTASNSMRVFQARLQQFSRAIGNMFMPILSAALPYLTAFVQVLTEGAQAIANFFGFELPKIDFSGAQVSSGFDDITGAINEATEANKEFKGSLASIDQLNIIGSESGSKSAALTGNQFDLGINLPEYDFLQGVESKTKEIADNMKNRFKEALPWIEAVGTAIIGVFATRKALDFVSALSRVKDVFAAISGTKLEGAAKAVTGIAGGLAAGATSGVLLFNGIKGLVTKTGDLAGNWGKVGAGAAVAIGAVTAFIALGNPVGAVITAVGAAIGIVAGAFSGVNEEIAKCNEIITDNILYHNGGTKISEIADAFGDWADKVTALNRQTIDKYKQLDEYDTKIDSVLQTMQEITGIDIDFSGITAADAEALKEPFNTLVTYLQGDFKDRTQTAANNLKEIFTNLGIDKALSDQIETAYKNLQIDFDTTLSDAQKEVSKYLDVISNNGKLSDVEMLNLQKNYNLALDLARLDKPEYQDVQLAIQELNSLDLSNIDLENDPKAQKAFNKIDEAMGSYYSSQLELYNQQTRNTAIQKLKIQTIFDSSDKNQEDIAKYNEQMGLLELSDLMFAVNYNASIDRLQNQIDNILGGASLELNKASQSITPTLKDWYFAISEGLIEGYNANQMTESAKTIAAGNWLLENPLAQKISSISSDMHTQVKIDIIPPREGTDAYEIYKQITQGGVIPMTAEIEIVEKSASDLSKSMQYPSYSLNAINAKWAEKAGNWIEEGLERGWNISTWENYTKELADVGARAFCEKYGIHSPSTLFEKYGGFMMKGLENGMIKNENLVVSAIDYTAVQSIMRLSKLKEDMERFNLGEIDTTKIISDFSFKAPTISRAAFEQPTGTVREAYEKSAASVSNSYDSGNLEATVPVTVQVFLENDMIMESVSEQFANASYRNNGKPLW